MDVYELTVSRRSVRSFKQDPAPEDLLERMVDAARLAPSAANLQPLRYLIVTDAALRAKVFETLKWAAYTTPKGTPAPGHEPTAYVIILKDERVTANNYKYDVGFSAENLLLTGLAEGLAGCALLSFDPRRIVQTFNLPEHLRPDLVVALGYPDEEPTYVDRSDTVKYWRDENERQIVPKIPQKELAFTNKTVWE